MSAGLRGRAVPAILLLLAACSRDEGPVGQAVDPLIWQQLQKLTPDDTLDAGASAFGTFVAVSGGTVVVGAPGHDPSGQGAAYVFARSGGVWAQQQELTAADATPNTFFGAAVSVSGDTAIVAAPDALGNQGAVHAFVRSGVLWSQQQELQPSDGSTDSLSNSVVAVDGDTAVVGSPYHGSGAVYLFTRSGGVWTQQQLIALDAAQGDLSGRSVAVSGDTVVFGAPGHTGQGAAYVFVLSNGAWIQQAELTAFNGAPGDGFGTAVGVNGDTAIVGAPGHELGQGGLAYVFTRAGSTWTGPLELAPPTPPFGFGSSVALTGDAALVSGIVEMAPTTGAVYAFARTGSTWTTQALVPGDSVPGDSFGISLAVDGTTAVAGNGDQAVYVFALGLANGDACTSGADCASGACTDGVCCVTAACPAPNGCQTATFCQAGTGTCQGTAKPDGLACDDGDACTHPDTCFEGACIGQAPKTCPPVDECHDFGSCDPVSAVCSSPAKADGMGCTGGMCTAGVCIQAGSGSSSSSSSGSGPVTPASHGCGCEVAGQAPGGGLAVGVALLMLARRRRGPRAGASR